MIDAWMYLLIAFGALGLGFSLLLGEFRYWVGGTLAQHVYENSGGIWTASLILIGVTVVNVVNYF